MQRTLARGVGDARRLGTLVLVVVVVRALVAVDAHHDARGRDARGAVRSRQRPLRVDERGAAPARCVSCACLMARGGWLGTERARSAHVAARLHEEDPRVLEGRHRGTCAQPAASKGQRVERPAGGCMGRTAICPRGAAAPPPFGVEVGADCPRILAQWRTSYNSAHTRGEQR